MSFNDIAFIQKQCPSMASMYEIYERYRKTLALLTQLECRSEQPQLLRDIADLKDEYLTSLKALAYAEEYCSPHSDYQRYLLHIKKNYRGTYAVAVAACSAQTEPITATLQPFL